MQLRALVASSVLALVVSILGAASVAAATWQRLTLEGQVGQAAFIVEGRVVSESTRLEDNQMIWTTYEIEVLDGLAGAARPGDRVAIKQLGGQVGEYRMMASNHVPMRVGQEAIFFSRSYGNDFPQLANGPQGFLAISSQPDPDPAKPPRRMLSSAMLLDDSARPVTADEMKAAIRAKVAELGR